MVDTGRTAIEARPTFGHHGAMTAFSPPSPRPSRSDEAEAAAALVRAAFGLFVPRLGREPTPMTYDWGKFIAAGEVFVIDGGNAAPVALVRLVAQTDALLVDTLAVRPDLQGNGLGRVLMDFADREALARGLSQLRLYTNVLMHENVALYRHLGFSITGEGGEPPFRRVFMERPVAA